MAKKRIIFFSILFFLMICFFFLLYSITPNLDKPVESAPITINLGWIGPLTGSAKMLGIDNLNAVKLAIQEYEASKTKSAPKINLIVEDDGYDSSRTITAYKKMMQGNNKPLLIFITTYSGLLKVAEYQGKAEVILVDPLDNDKNLEKLGRNVFLIAKLTEEMSSLLINTLIADKRNRIAIIYFDADYFMTTMTKLVRTAMRDRGTKTIIFPYHPNESNFIPDLNAAIQFQADAYLFFGYVEIGAAMKQAKELGIKAPFYSINTIMTDKISGDALEGTQFVHFTSLDGNRGLAELFLERFQNQYHYRPPLEWPALQAYDATNIILNKIENVAQQPGSMLDNLRDSLFDVTNYPGVTGDITIKSSGASEGIHPRLYIFHNGLAVPKE